MVIYLKHPTHGTKVACAEAEAVYDESLGWTRYTPAGSEPAVRQSDELQSLRDAYEAKFGKPPHHKKSAETLKEELAE